MASLLGGHHHNASQEAVRPRRGDDVVGGPGARKALLMVPAELLSAAVSIGGYLIRTIRDAETMLPDHDTVVMAA